MSEMYKDEGLTVAQNISFSFSFFDVLIANAPYH